MEKEKFMDYDAKERSTKVMFPDKESCLKKKFPSLSR